MLKNENNKIVVFDFKEVMLLEEIDDDTTKVVFKNGYVQKLHNSIKEVYKEGKLSLEDVYAYAKQNGEPKQVSGKQELYEAILNMYC